MLENTCCKWNSTRIIPSFLHAFIENFGLYFLEALKLKPFFHNSWKLCVFQVLHTIQWLTETREKCSHARKAGELPEPGYTSIRTEHKSDEPGHIPGLRHATEGAASSCANLREPDAERCGHTVQVRRKAKEKLHSKCTVRDLSRLFSLPVKGTFPLGNKWLFPLPQIINPL